MQCLHPITLNYGKEDERVVPCGKCLNCLANKRAEWCIRLRAELQSSDFGLFVTLTNDDDHLHYVDVVNSETGEVAQKQAPDKRTIQLFLKRLRKVIGNRNMRYFIISEYGDRTQRLHYHGLFFFHGIQLDKKLYDAFNSCWTNGFVKFGDVTDASIAYCTKYVLKLSAFPLGINDNIMLCSRNPALGSLALIPQIIEENAPKGNLAQISLHGASARLPRLFRDKLGSRFEHYDQDIEEYKLSAQNAALQERAKSFAEFKRNNPSKNVYDFMRYEEEINNLKAMQMTYRIKKQNNF